jgi:cytosine/creatinine deaminase
MACPIVPPAGSVVEVVPFEESAEPAIPGASAVPAGPVDPALLLETALAEARLGQGEGGVPIGAALYRGDGTLLGRGRNRRVQHDDPSAHAETDAFRQAGRQRSYRDTIMVTTLAPCWYCSGLIRQFRIPTVIIGESTIFRGGIDWLAQHGVTLITIDSAECHAMMAAFIGFHPDIWAEDIGED